MTVSGNIMAFADTNSESGSADMGTGGMYYSITLGDNMVTAAVSIDNLGDMSIQGTATYFDYYGDYRTSLLAGADQSYSCGCTLIRDETIYNYADAYFSACDNEGGSADAYLQAYYND